MTWIRIVGLTGSLVLIIIAVAARRRKSISRGDVLLLTVISGGLLAVSLYPPLLNGVLLFKRQSRIVTLLVLGQLSTLTALVWIMLRMRGLERAMGQLIHNMAIREFSKEFGDSANYSKKILVVIPAYNEAENLRTVLKKLPKEIEGYHVEAIVCVDGATDETERVVREHNFPAIVNQINRGGGAALKAGYDLAIRHGAEIVVTMDADGQHLPEEIPKLVKPIIDGEVDFVNGSRILGTYEKGEQIRRLGIFFFNRLVSILLWRRITDCSNAFRAIRVSELSKLDLREKQFHTTELLIEGISKGLRFREIPITIKKRLSGETKKPTSLNYGLGFARAIFRTWLRT